MARPTALAIPDEVSTLLLCRFCERTLTERTGGDLDTVGDTVLGVTWGDGTDLTELLEVIHGDLVAGKVEHDVLQSTTETRQLRSVIRGKRLTRVRWRGRIGHG